jgi:hypothetical protein
MSVDDEKYYGTSYLIPNTRAQNGELVYLTAVHYREDCLRDILIPKLVQTLSRFGVRELSGEEVLRHAIGHSRDPLILTGLKFINQKSYSHDYLRNEFLSTELALADAVLKIIFCEADSVAKNSSPISLTSQKWDLSFNTNTAFRQAVVFYKPSDSAPNDLLRVTIGGVGIDTPSTMQFERSKVWHTNRYSNPRIRHDSNIGSRGDSEPKRSVTRSQTEVNRKQIAEPTRCVTRSQTQESC